MECSLDEMKSALEALNKRIEFALREANRAAGSVKLIWVSKFHPFEAVQNAISLGATDFGENRVQEAELKFANRSPGIRCHVIGPVQSNKLRKACAVADCIHSISSFEQVRKLDRIAGELGKTLEVLFQVNVAEEETKSGLEPGQAEAFLNALPEPRNLKYKGLMTIGRNTGVPEDSRECFAFLRKLRDKFLMRGGIFSEFTELSMGMTLDLEVAIEEGATMIRVGTALFGERDYSLKS